MSESAGAASTRRWFKTEAAFQSFVDGVIEEANLRRTAMQPCWAVVNKCGEIATDIEGWFMIGDDDMLPEEEREKLRGRIIRVVILRVCEEPDE